MTERTGLVQASPRTAHSCAAVLRRMAACTLLAHACTAAQAAGPAPAVVDRVFAELDRADSPGCALAVVRAGRPEVMRGYGMANLEWGIPITPRTVFDLGSVSKQFTAASILLLAQDGRLSLDDDIHRFVPELPDYGAPVSLRHMLHHLSGIPSYTDLFDLAGIPEIDLTTDSEALELLRRQPRLNFAPGAQYLYSDSNYFLLSLVVRRVSGQSLAQFAQRRIFGPLGMTHTHFHDDHTLIVRHRAQGYAPRPGGGFAIDMSNFEQLGDGAVMTTAEDMVRWDANFERPVVGGPQLVALLQEPGVRADGSSSRYAMGLLHDTYRGESRVQHTGEWVGYRASFLRLPARRISVITLCNSIGDVDPLGLSERVLDLYLPASAGREGKGAPSAGRADLPADASLAGIFWNARTFALLQFEWRGGRLHVVDGDDAQPLAQVDAAAESGRTFVGQDSTTRYRFVQEGGIPRVIWHTDDSDPVELERVAGQVLVPTPLAALGGRYRSDALGATWILEESGGRLIRRQWMFPEQQLRAVLPDTFVGDLSEATYVLHFTRDAAGRIDGFDVGTTMVRPLHFVRVDDAVAPLAH